MSISVEVLQSHHAIAEWHVEGISCYILRVFVRILGHGSLVVQTALAIRSRYEELLAEVVLDASHQAHGERRNQLARIIFRNQVEARSAQIVQVVGITKAVGSLIIESPLGRSRNNPTQLAGPTDSILVFGSLQIAVRKCPEEVGQADMALATAPCVL